MSREEVFTVLDKLKNIGVQRIMLTGGEPTMRTDFVQILSYAAENFVAISVGSNGYCITEPMIKHITKYKSNIVFQISVDGTEKNHNLIRGKSDSHQKATISLELLQKYNIPVTIAMTISELNFNDMEAVAEYSNNLGAIQLRYSVTMEMGGAKKSFSKPNITYRDCKTGVIAFK